MNWLSPGKSPFACMQVTSTSPSFPLTVSELHERYLGLVFCYVSRRISRRAEAEDITAEVFVAAFAMLTSFRGHCEPHLWLLGIARRKVADALRLRSRRKETLASETELHDGEANALLGHFASQAASPEKAAEQAEARLHLRALMETLNPAQRETLLLHYIEELSLNEISVVMQRSPQAINSLLQRARANLFRSGRSYFLDENGDEK